MAAWSLQLNPEQILFSALSAAASHFCPSRGSAPGMSFSSGCLAPFLEQLNTSNICLLMNCSEPLIPGMDLSNLFNVRITTAKDTHWEKKNLTSSDMSWPSSTTQYFWYAMKEESDIPPQYRLMDNLPHGLSGNSYLHKRKLDYNSNSMTELLEIVTRKCKLVIPICTILIHQRCKTSKDGY